jgi:hypothetical protein
MSQELILFIQYRISMVFLLAFVVIFTPLRYGWKGTTAIVVLCFLATGVCDAIIAFWQVEGIPTTWVTLLEIPMTQIFALFLCRYRDGRGLFTGITAAAYVLAGNVAFSLLNNLTGKTGLSFFVQIGLHLTLLCFFVKYLREGYQTAMEEKGKYWLYLCLIPALFYACVYSICVWPVDIVEVPANGLGGTLIILALFSAYLLIFQLYIRHQRENELGRANDYLRNFSKHVKRESRTVRESNQKMAVMRHDMRHHVRILDAYLQAGEVQKARKVLLDIDQNLDATRPRFYCKNIAINGIMFQEYNLAKQFHVQLDTRLDIPENLKVSEFEWATVVANLVENAIEGAAHSQSRNPWVRMTAHPVKGRLVIEIANSCSRKLKETEKLPPSTKGEGHGLGLKSVMAFVTQHNGVFDYQIRQEVFTVRLWV